MDMPTCFKTTFSREVATTRRVLANVPSDKLDYQPHEKARTLKQLAWTIAYEGMFFTQFTENGIDFSAGVPWEHDPAGMEEILSTFESYYEKADAAIQNLDTAAWDGMAKSWRGNDAVRGEELWGLLLDMVHHRGQLSVYLRATGAPVPSIYGPSADEPNA
jgi:uncharacterized damage-inducible protein DinB